MALVYAANPALERLWHEAAHLLKYGDETFQQKLPGLLLSASVDELRKDVEFSDPNRNYSRTLVAWGDENEPAFLAMKWLGGVGPHDHGGRPCAERLLEGRMKVSGWRKRFSHGDLWELDDLGSETANPREIITADSFYDDRTERSGGVVRTGETHSLGLLTESALTINCYPMRASHSNMYVEQGALWERKTCSLPAIDHRALIPGHSQTINTQAGSP